MFMILHHHLHECQRSEVRVRFRVAALYQLFGFIGGDNNVEAFHKTLTLYY